MLHRKVAPSVPILIDSMKRFILLAGLRYYLDGWNDYSGSFDTAEEALEKAKLFLAREGYDWYEIIDQKKETVVMRGNS